MEVIYLPFCRQQAKDLRLQALFVQHPQNNTLGVQHAGKCSAYIAGDLFVQFLTKLSSNVIGFETGQISGHLNILLGLIRAEQVAGKHPVLNIANVVGNSVGDYKIAVGF